MDAQASAIFAEGLKTEIRMQIEWFKTMDLSDAKEIPKDVQYQSSSIAAQPFKKHLVQETKAFKPQITRENFERSKKAFGMCTSELMYVRARGDGRPPTQVFRGTGRNQEVGMKAVPDALANKAYFGKPDATAAFYRKSGAFAATEEKDH